MDLLVWIILLGAALVFIGLGTFRPAESYHAIIGFTLLLLLGGFLMGFSDWSVTQTVGANTTTTYSYTGNFTNTTSEITTYTYDTVQGTGLTGFLLIIFGALGLSVTFFQLRSGGPSDED